MLNNLLKIGFKYFQSLDRDKALKRGEQIGSLLYKIGYRKDVLLKNFEIAFPELTPEERLQLVKKTLQFMGINLVEFARIPLYVKTNQVLDLVNLADGKEILDKYNGKGAILITGHIGNWEITNVALAGYGYKIVSLAYRQKNREINELVNNIRTSLGTEIIYHDQPLKKMLQAIREGKILAFLADQNALRHRGVFVDFFGLPASTISFPAKLALKYRIPIIFAYNHFNENTKKYNVYFKEIDISKFDKGDIKGLTQAFTKEIEEAIRKKPHQYLWTHKRWKTRPEGEEENIYK
jgi:KDO2-lipid IV(A) lauroyltransferase